MLDWAANAASFKVSLKERSNGLEVEKLAEVTVTIGYGLASGKVLVTGASSGPVMNISAELSWSAAFGSGSVGGQAAEVCAVTGVISLPITGVKDRVPRAGGGDGGVSA